VARVTISTREEFEAWLTTQPREVCVAIAYCAAMRVLPFVTHLRSENETTRALVLAALRAGLTAGVFVRSPGVGPAATAASDALSHASGIAYSSSVDTEATTLAAVAISAAAKGDGIGAVFGAAYAHADYALELSRGGPAYAVEDHVREAAVRDALPMFLHDARPQVSVEDRIDVPEQVAAQLRTFSEARTDFLASGGPWTFWAEWYARAMAGDPLPWALQEKIALIPNDIWEAGPEAVAAEIERIREEFEGWGLDTDAVQAQASRLIDRSAFHAEVAKDAAEIMEAAIARYKDEAPDNDLPDGFAAYSQIAPVFRMIARTLTSGDPRERKVEALCDELQRLHALVAQLRRELREERQKLHDLALTLSEGNRFKQKGTALIATVADLATISSFLLMLYVTFEGAAGNFAYQSIKDEMTALTNEMCGAEPTEEPPRSELPDTLET
jgi:hypothetical protein